MSVATPLEMRLRLLPPEAIARHGLSALLADYLTDDALLADARATIARGLKTKRLALAVLDALRAVGLVPILLKGYGLAQRLYPGQPLARPSTDVDLLFTEAELVRARPVLASLGLHEFQDPVDHAHHVAFSGPRGLVEAHFKLFNGFGGGEFDEKALRARRVAATLDGRPVFFLAPADEFLYLATHAANHGFLRLSWLVDLAYYVGKQPLDWPLMALRARAAGFLTAVASSLHTLERVLQVQLPAQATRHFPLPALRAALDSRLFSTDMVSSALVSNHWLGGFALRLWLVDSAAHGVRHVVEGARRYLRRSGA